MYYNIVLQTFATSIQCSHQGRKINGHVACATTDDDDYDDEAVVVDEECDTNNNDDGRRRSTRRMVIDNERELLLTAMNVATKRVVVKRPLVHYHLACHHYRP